MNRAIVTLLTDFGYQDAYVGVMKGVIAGRCDAQLIDLTHGIALGDIASAAYLLHTAWRYFPDATVHLAVVDPGVGTDRPVLAAEVAGQHFVAPDNGLLTDVLAAHAERRKKVVTVTRQDLFLPNMSRTFHGRDVFAPVAAALANGTPLEDLGEPADDYVKLHRRPPTRTGNRIEGQVVYVDHFGNLVTNIEADQLRGLGDIRVQIAGQETQGLAESYAAVPPGTLIAIVGSTNRLEISIANGHAATELEATIGEPVCLEYKEPPTNKLQ